MGGRALKEEGSREGRDQTPTSLASDPLAPSLARERERLEPGGREGIIPRLPRGLMEASDPYSLPNIAGGWGDRAAPALQVGTDGTHEPRGGAGSRRVDVSLWSEMSRGASASGTAAT